MITIMNKKRLIFTLFLLSLIGLGVGVYFVKFFDCGDTVSCYFLLPKLQGIFYGTVTLTFVFFILTLLPKTFFFWWSILKWYFVFSLAIIFSYKEPGTWDIAPRPQIIYLWLSIGFVAISIISIIIALIVQKNRKSISEIEPSKKL